MSSNNLTPVEYLYIHYPFCKQKCIYCDFPTTLYKNKYWIENYIKWLERELILRKDLLSQSIRTIYIGGGTPSLLHPKEILELLDSISKVSSLHSLEEFTIEVNPEDVNPELVNTLKDIRNIRVSIGIQSMNEKVLQWLKRNNTIDHNKMALKLVSEDIENFNVDIIYGIPGVRWEELKKDLGEILRYKPKHVSAYVLSVEEYTPLKYFVETGKISPPFEGNEEIFINLYYSVKHFLEDAGFIHYEISNFALPNYLSLHNLNYWNLGKFVGIGAGASGYVENYIYKNTIHIPTYIQKISTNILPNENITVVNEKTFLKLLFLMGLRKIEGIDIKTTKNENIITLKNILQERLMDFLDVDEFIIKLKNDKLHLLDFVIKEIFSIIEEMYETEEKI